MKTHHLLFTIISFSLTSCFGLDDNLFNPDTSITEYQFDHFTGKQEIEVVNYAIDDSLIHLFTLEVGNAGEKIYAVYIGDTNRINTDSIIVYCHGNAGHMDYYWPRAKLLGNVNGTNNYGVLMMDYRGYGISQGKPSEENMYEDVDACIVWLKNKGLTNDRFFMYGFSLGASAACQLTANPRSLTPTKLLLESPFASAATLIQEGSGLALPSTYFVDLKVDNAQEIKKIKQPFYWIHGEEDDFLEIDMNGQVIYDNYQGVYKEAHRIPEAVHNNVPKIMGYPEYIESIGTFLRR
jgi:pimeloyl-ACP methyl ester carboxylesterase